MVTDDSSNGKIEYSAEEIPESRLYTAKSILTIKPKKEYHNTTFICQAQNAAERTYQSAKIRLYVRYAPKVSTLFWNNNLHINYVPGTWADLREKKNFIKVEELWQNL